MRKPWRIWLTLTLCALVILAAMGWISSQWLDDKRVLAEAIRKSDFEENVRLALGRADLALAPLIVEESSRPFFVYRPFYMADRAYDKKFTEIGAGEVRVPSPLLTLESPALFLHFQFEPNGLLTSPQVPLGSLRKVASSKMLPEATCAAREKRLAELERLFDRQTLLAALTPSNDAVATALVESNTSNTSNTWYDVEPQSAGQQSGVQQFDDSQTIVQVAPRQSIVQLKEVPAQQRARTSAELNSRRRTYGRFLNDQADNFQLQMLACTNFVPSANATRSVMNPVWMGDQLILARRVTVGKEEYVQGCWIDWQSLQEVLLADIRDLLPEARLEPVLEGSGERPNRMLAALPVELVPGSLPALELGGIWSNRMFLVAAWSSMLIAAIAIAVLVGGAVSLSERRGAFVSAVTHELRTPLTTFQLYTEMLAEDMVQDEAKKKRYLNTLRTEADRLGHMVENVLSYARLESGRQGGRIERIASAELIDRVQARLANRAEQAGMKLDVNLQTEAGGGVLHARADISTVEQILLNLVDNACKYGGTADDKTIRLDVHSGVDDTVRIAVRDHGPGISAAGARRLFQPFSKSAHEAACSAPGVGLGLALSRRLARAMGGDLQLDPGSEKGATFVLSLMAG